MLQKITTTDGIEVTVGKVTGTDFYLYGQSEHVSWADVVQQQEVEMDLLVGWGFSGCESSYVEVARWFDEQQEWFRWCFLKVLDTRFFDREGEYIEVSDGEKSRWLGESIEQQCDWATVVHNMVDWEDRPSVKNTMRD